MPEGGFATEPADVQAMQLDNAEAFVAWWDAPEPAPLTCAELETVQAPTLVVVGSKTLPAFREMGKAVAACLPEAELATMAGVGHEGPVAAAGAFGDLALGFIDGS